MQNKTQFSIQDVIDKNETKINFYSISNQISIHFQNQQKKIVNLIFNFKKHSHDLITIHHHHHHRHNSATTTSIAVADNINFKNINGYFLDLYQRDIR